MNFRFTVVETSLNRAEFRWKWLKLLRYSFTLAAVACLSLLLIGAAIVSGWLTNKTLASSLVALIGVLGFIAWIVVIISVFAGTPDRNWLASALERVDERLLDRLHTLLFLESRRGDPQTESFALRIARQTQTVLAEKPSPSPFSASLPLLPLCAFILILAITVLLSRIYSPWERLLAADKAQTTRHLHPDKPFDLALPATNNVEQDRVWGEVRITDPGADLKVTKLDVVPLQIEAAANQSLKDVAWFSAINGTEEAQHELPPPNEPRYAVYQPTVYLDELRLADWDVVTYYAKATTEQKNSYGSGVYFMEVRPFREDILKLPGGEGGQAYRCLNEMSALINRQQHVIRQTYQHVQQPPAQENLRQQDRGKLSEAERDLSDSAQHLYAKMAAAMENKPIGEALDNLAKAEQSLDRASRQLDANALSDAQNRERSALSELVAARKIFQKTVSEHPEAFDEPTPDEESSKVADGSKKLNQMTEFRNESKAAEDFVQKTLAQQKALEQQAKAARRNDFPRLGEQEKQLQEALQDFEKDHPKIFDPIQSDSQEAQEAMLKAAESLQQRSNDARESIRDATQNLENLSQALKENSAQHQLADAYKLKQMLDGQIQTLGKCSNPGGSVSDADLQKTAAEARDTLNQLKKVAEQEPTRDAFGQPLRDSLNGQNKVELDARLNRLEQAQTEFEKQQRAADAKDALSGVSRAFTESEPKTSQIAQRTDSLKPSQQDSLNQGIAQLDSLMKQLEKDHPLPRDQQTKQGKEALFNLQSGLRSQHGDNQRGNQILLQLEKMLKTEAPLEVADLKKLMDELQHFSVETSDLLAKKDDKPDVTNIDPTRLPPAYRGRIQKYFQKLSEK